MNRRTWTFLALGAAGLCLTAVHLVVTMELWDNVQHNSRVFIEPPADSTAFVSYPLDLWEIANAAKPEGVDLQQISGGGGGGLGEWQPGAGTGIMREVTLLISHGDQELLAILPADAATRAAVLDRLETEFRERLAAWNPDVSIAAAPPPENSPDETSGDGASGDGTDRVTLTYEAETTTGVYEGTVALTLGPTTYQLRNSPPTAEPTVLLTIEVEEEWWGRE